MPYRVQHPLVGRDKRPGPYEVPQTAPHGSDGGEPSRDRQVTAVAPRSTGGEGVERTSLTGSAAEGLAGEIA